MFAFDMPLDELKRCVFAPERPRDFYEFWNIMIARSRKQPLNPDAAPLKYAVPEVKVEEVSFEAFDGGRIVGWMLSPAKVQPRPTLIFFHGYGGNKGRVAQYLMWALQGFTVLTFDVRGQLGQSSDLADYPGGRSSGWMTSGIMDPEKHYFVRCYLDTVRAIDFAETCVEVDRDRIGMAGASQGGGLSLAAACLDDRLKLCMAEVPGFCHFGRTLQLTKAAPWTDLISYFSQRPQDMDQAMRTLSYVELNNMADRIKCPTLISIGLQDELCPPSTIFTVYNQITVRDKLAEVFPYNGHEAGLNIETMVAWARKFLLNR